MKSPVGWTLVQFLERPGYKAQNGGFLHRVHDSSLFGKNSLEIPQNILTIDTSFQTHRTGNKGSNTRGLEYF